MQALEFMCLRSYLSTTMAYWGRMEATITFQYVIGRVKLDSKKTKALLGRQPKVIVIFSFFV